ncbi:hypothetical protein pRALTA_0233 (plasmid) [Cupriavidus taiwanensis LMG 19424]|uniref:Uncharacterized protein n=6 Tax=Burkholderiaceae TaxID=119060 RepID=B2AK84_CUPTR|nr:hypothetical protein pRALTA_0233 [Cupriavidus taiwanensis LMG 19424]SPC24883.1 conserved hypothetical protein [Cupriavidus taiwanensis]SPD61521.1 conserved protein of unknown function [Cupriavidus taiwanensis]SPD62232.1 conserved protein of unknown function [Cupriavidus neocaledonicus]SPD69351.1 conserved protein of unknown function [Cupriavidus taiwanensis]
MLLGDMLCPKHKISDRSRAFGYRNGEYGPQNPVFFKNPRRLPRYSLLNKKPTGLRQGRGALHSLHNQTKSGMWKVYSANIGAF